MNAFWKFKHIPKKNYQYPNIAKSMNDLSLLSANYYEGKLENEIITGRAWKPTELRLKSSAELHKLWYVLLREKMALTSEIYYSAQKSYLSTIIKRDLVKVKLSMNRIKTIINERDALRNDFMLFLEFWYIRKQQNLEKAKLHKEDTEKKEKKITVGQIEDQSETRKSVKNTKKNNKNKTKNTAVSILTKQELTAVYKLKKKYNSKSNLIRDYIKNPDGLVGKEKRRIFNIIQKARAKTAKEIFMKEMAAISYKLRNSKKPEIEENKEIEEKFESKI
jgi:large subunit ribosomal protein L47